MLRNPIVAGLLTLLIGGCGASPLPSPGQPTETPIVNASPLNSPVSTPRELPAGSAALPPATYMRSDFEPRVSFRVAEGWVTGTVADGFFDVQQDQGTPNAIAVQFATVEGIVGANGQVVAATTAQAAARTIHENDGIDLIDESDSRIGGLAGSNVVVENRVETQASVLQLRLGMLGIDPQRRLWISLFDTPNGVLAIMVGGSVAKWDDALTTAEPVLESIVIGG